MRKINKIMMATVSILLTLVLISSCVLSGIFAKYVTSKTASSQMQFERFGVSLSMALGTGVTGTVTSNAAGNSVTATVTNLKMGPGDAFYDALKVSVTGTPNVPVEIKMSCKVEYPDGVDYDKDGIADYGSAYVIDESITGSDSECFMPLGFIFKTPADNTEGSPICYPWHQKNSNLVTEAVMRNLADKVFGETYSSTLANSKGNTDGAGTWFYEKNYDAKKALPTNMSEFSIGFYLPYEFGSDAPAGLSKDTSAPKLTIATHDKMATAIASATDNSGISFVYTITITQVQSVS